MFPALTFDVFGTAFSVASYSLMAALGAVLGVVIACPLLKRAGLRTITAFRLLLLMAAFFLIGARLLNYLVNNAIYGGGLHLSSFRFAGFSLYGGILGSFGALMIWSCVTRRSPWKTLDALILPSAAAFVFARIGCYLNGCCSGKATDSILGVVFPVKKGGEALLSALLPVLPIREIAVYPTQLFEAGVALIGLVPTLWLYFRGKYEPGTAFLAYGIWFTAMRWAILPLRSLPYSEIVVKVVYPSLYGILICTGVFLLLWRHKKAASQTSESLLYKCNQ